MDEIYTYIVDLPDQVREIVTPCADGFTIWIDARLDEDQRMAAFRHALGHIEREDFLKCNVQEVEEGAHNED